MTFAVDMPAAARRHLEAANTLFAGSRKDVAGYLFGLAAECAVKAMMHDAGVKSVSATENRREDPYFAHFPELRTMLRDGLKGRIGSPLATFVNSDAFMNTWSTKMRYSHGKDIAPAMIQKWSEQAHQAVAAINT